MEPALVDVLARLADILERLEAWLPDRDSPSGRVLARRLRRGSSTDAVDAFRQGGTDGR